MSPTTFSHVLALGLPEVPDDPKRFCFEAVRDVLGPNSCAYLIEADDIAKLTKPVPGRAALLAGLDHRPPSHEVRDWAERLGAGKSQVMLGHKVWALATRTFSATHVAPNRHRVLSDPSRQVTYDIAVADDYRRRTAVHHPFSLDEHYRKLGFGVKGVNASHGPDGLVTGYDAVIEMDDVFDRRGLVAIGRHSRFSGLLVPVEEAA